MQTFYLFITALGTLEEDQLELCAVDVRNYCKNFVGTNTAVLTDFSRMLPEDCFCGLPVETVQERVTHDHDHYLYYQSAWCHYGVSEVYASGSIYDALSRSALQSLVDLCCIGGFPCQFKMYE